MSETEQIVPEENDASDYLRIVEGGEKALHLYLKDDKEWWVVHNPDSDYPGSLNGPWLFWTTYPSGPWELSFHSRQIAHHHLDELYYRDYYGDETHSIHRAKLGPISNAPYFVLAELEDSSGNVHTGGDR